MQAGGVDFTIMLLLGLASSLHCVTMCGPVIAVASAPRAGSDEERPGPWARLAGWQTLYNAGRGLTYTAIGVALGFTGTVISSLGGARLLGGGLQVLLGGLIVILTIVLVARGKAVRAPAGEGWLTRTLRRLMTSGRPAGMLGLGLVTGFLPCGVLYAAFARSLAASSPLEGGLLMLAFWAGTVPLLFAVGFASGSLLRAVGKRAVALLVVVMLATGGWLVFRGVRTLTTEQPACHHEARHALAIQQEAEC